jgi:mannose-6-phosphate isomerase-like protein (cupin superfamily)
MRTATMLRRNQGFRIVLTNRRMQIAEMVVAPGDAEGGPNNRHPRSDQWLLVLSGNGEARVNGRRHRIRPGSLVLIEQGDRHEVRNTGRTPLKTLNAYAPPAYRSDGTTLGRTSRSAK